jgi:hypothetical protein
MPLSTLQTRIITQPPPGSPPPPGGGVGGVILSSLVVMDFNDPNNPIVASFTNGIPTPGSTSVFSAAEFLDPLTHLFYILSGKHGGVGPKLNILDLTNRSAPVLLSSTVLCTIPDDGYRAALGGSILYCANSGATGAFTAANNVQQFDISNPATPITLPGFNVKTDFGISQFDSDAAIIVGNNLYISSSNGAAGKSQLGIYDITNPLVVTQTSVTDIRNTGFVNDANAILFAIVGNYAFFSIYVTSTNETSVETWNISNPAAPVMANTVAIPVPVPGSNPIIQFSQIANGHAYGFRQSADHNIYPVNISNPLALVALAPTLVSGAGDSFSIQAAGTKVYLCKEDVFPDERLRVFDATVPGALVQMGSVVYSASGVRQQLHLDV